MQLGKQQSHRVRFWRIVLGGIIALSVIAVIRWRGRMIDTGTPLMVSSNDSCILVFGNRPAELRFLPTPPRTGDRHHAYSAKVAYWHDSMVYWSEQERAFCLLPLNGKPQWITAEHQFPSGMQVNELTPVADGVIVNLLDAHGIPCAAFAVQIPSGRIQRLPRARAVRASDISQTIAVLTPKGTIEIRRGSSIRQVPHVMLPLRNAIWDYRPEMDALCYMERGRVVVRRENGQLIGRCSPALTVTEVALQPEDQQVWVAEQQQWPWYPEMKLLAYSITGNFLGTRLRYPTSEFRRPMQNANRTIAALWEHYWGM